MDKREKIRVGIIYSAESILFLLAATLLGMGFGNRIYGNQRGAAVYPRRIYHRQPDQGISMGDSVSSVAATYLLNYFLPNPIIPCSL